MKISEHFHDYELLSPDIIQACKDAKIPTAWFVSDIAISVLEELREEYGACSVNHKGMNYRGICTNAENHAQGRNITSQHNYEAFDCSFSGVDYFNIYLYIKKNFKGIVGGVGVYDTFIHIDFRNSEDIIFWDKRTC